MTDVIQIPVMTAWDVLAQMMCETWFWVFLAIGIFVPALLARRWKKAAYRGLR